jgi:CRP-like cAMP-binding protein
MQTMDALEDLIVKHPFLFGLNPYFYHFFNECALLRRYDPGQEIFHEHGNADSFFLIKNGKVALETFVPGRGMETIHALEPGEALGWSWLFPPYQWHFTAKAIEPAELIVFDAIHLREKTEENRDFGNDLLARVARVLLQRLQATRRRLIGFYGVIE